MRLNAQYGSMMRTSLSVRARLMRVQAVRQKRDATAAGANEDAWARYIAERSMLEVVEAQTGPAEPARPQQAPVAAPEACVDPGIEDNVSENDINSHDMAFETWLSAQSSDLGSVGSGETDMRKFLFGATRPSPQRPGTGHRNEGMPGAMIRSDHR